MGPDSANSVSPAAVEVRWLSLERVGARAWEALESLLDDSERARAGRFHFDRDRRAYIAAHALLRAMLSGEVPRPSTSWRFSTGEFGKPELVQAPGDPPLRFNLSHTRGLVAVALTHTHEIGIDVEAVDVERLSQKLAERFFAPPEIELLRATPPHEQQELRFAIWTMKEAVIKALGQGLLMPLDEFAVSFEPPAVEFSPRLGEMPGRWLLQSLKPAPAYRLALALRHPNPETVSVRISEATEADVLTMAREPASLIPSQTA